MVAYTDDTFVARKQKHQLSNQIEHDKKLSEKAERNDKNYEKKIQNSTDNQVSDLEKKLQEKEKEIMTI